MMKHNMMIIVIDSALNRYKLLQCFILQSIISNKMIKVHKLIFPEPSKYNYNFFKISY